MNIHNCGRVPAPTRSLPGAPDANRTATTFAPAAALLLCLALTGQAAAESPQVDADAPEASAFGDDAGTFTSEEDLSPDTFGDDVGTSASEEGLSMDTFEDGDGTLPDENGDVAAGTDVQPPAAGEEELSEGKQLQKNLKRTLLGLLLPAMERKIRDAAGVDDEASGQIAEADPESGDTP